MIVYNAMSEKSNIDLSDRTYDILRTLGKDADFLYDTINKYINDAQKENRQDLVDMWKTIRQDREKHVHMLKEDSGKRVP